MSANTTNSAKGRMDCGRVTRDEIIESYLVGRLSDEDRDAFEAHYFECARCFGDLQALQAIQGELQSGGRSVRTQSDAPGCPVGSRRRAGSRCRPGGRSDPVDAAIGHAGFPRSVDRSGASISGAIASAAAGPGIGAGKCVSGAAGTARAS